MITYSKINENNNLVEYEYKVWGKGEGGTVVFDKTQNKYVELNKAKEDEFGKYMIHMIGRIDDMYKKNSYEDSGKAIWL